MSGFVRTGADFLSRLAYPLIALAVLVAAWDIAVRLFAIPSYVLPKPGDVFAAFETGYIRGANLVHVRATLTAAAGGYLIGCTFALITAALVAESRLFEKFIFPIIVALQCMPKVALAPLIIIWFGFGLESKLVLVALICYFPLLINTIVGLRSADHELIDLMQAYGASRSFTFFNVKVFAAAPHVFAGMQVGVVFALIGTVVAEFVSSKHGLGIVIQGAALDMNTATMFAAIFVLGLMGVIATSMVKALHRWTIFWNPPTANSAVSG